MQLIEEVELYGQPLGVGEQKPKNNNNTSSDDKSSTNIHVSNTSVPRGVPTIRGKRQLIKDQFDRQWQGGEIDTSVVDRTAAGASIAKAVQRRKSQTTLMKELLGVCKLVLLLLLFKCLIYDIQLCDSLPIEARKKADYDYLCSFQHQPLRSPPTDL